eukprot:g32701.t1
MLMYRFNQESYVLSHDPWCINENFSTPQTLIRETKLQIQEKCNAVRKYFENEEKEACKYLDKVQRHVTREIDAQILELENKMEDFEKNLSDFSDLLTKNEKLIFIQ